MSSSSSSSSSSSCESSSAAAASKEDSKESVVRRRRRRRHSSNLPVPRRSANKIKSDYPQEPVAWLLPASGAKPYEIPLMTKNQCVTEMVDFYGPLWPNTFAARFKCTFGRYQVAAGRKHLILLLPARSSSHAAPLLDTSTMNAHFTSELLTDLFNPEHKDVSFPQSIFGDVIITRFNRNDIVLGMRADDDISKWQAVLLEHVRSN